MSLPLVTITTDGSCYPNDGTGKGGWAAILRFDTGDVKQISGGERNSSNNKMELAAVLNALKFLIAPRRVILRTDSQYVLKSCTVWRHKWAANGWVTGDGEPVKNQDLIRAITDELARHNVEWVWVRGHDGDEDNEACDVLAAEARRAV